MANAHLAIDLGASSGRAILGLFDTNSGTITLEEVHRFEHLACPTPAGPVWDLTGIWQHVLTGLGRASRYCKDNGVELKTIGVDTWGVDWALLGPSGELLALPHCYRDPQNDTACENVLQLIGGFEYLYDRTGIQLMSLNTIFQVAARFEREPRLFDAAARFLLLPDLFHYWLSGELATERSIASTSSLLHVDSGEWDAELLTQLGLPTEIFGPIVEPGTVLGCVRPEVAELTGAPADLQVVTPAAHDTASAVAAVPATGTSDWAYLSSGTWSLLGAELAEPIATEESRQVPLTNERGVDGSIRLLKNIAGLWLIQELRRDLQREGHELGFAALVEEARQADPFRTLVDPDYGEFGQTGNMQRKLRAFARESGQPEPESVGQLVRCCLESLALRYSHTLSQLESVVAQPIDVLHIVGGGIQNRLLNELTAEAIERPVVTGPVEATAIGNLLVQAMGCGALADLKEIRQVVSNSFDVETLAPVGDVQWDEPRSRFAELCAG